jgi:hypothetical protein
MQIRVERSLLLGETKGDTGCDRYFIGDIGMEAHQPAAVCRKMGHRQPHTMEA